MKKRDILKLSGKNGISQFMSVSGKQHYQINEYIGGILRDTPEDSIIFNQDSDFEAVVVFKNLETKAVAVGKEGWCIGTKKEIPPESREELADDIFFCAWPDPYENIRLVWIEQLDNEYRNCTLSITGYHPIDAVYLSKAMLQTLLQAILANRGEYKPLLDKAFGPIDRVYLNLTRSDSSQLNDTIN